MSKLPKGAKKIDLSVAFPGESRMDRIKARLGSNNDYKTRAKVVSAYKSASRHDRRMNAKAQALHKRTKHFA